MCGIAGWVGEVDGDPQPLIEEMVAGIAHRGPDGRGSWTGPGAGLGMARLAIIDLTHGEQPKFAGPWVVVFNGEIYNYRELRSELAAEGVAFDGTGDSEVVAHAIDRWGDAAFARLDGMYAIAAHHQGSGRLVLARDRFGEKPLYVWERGRTVAFASELRALRPLGSMPALDEGSLARYLALGFVPGPESIHQGITMLPPGHRAEVVDGKVSVTATVSAGSGRGGEGGHEEPQDAHAPGGDVVDELDRRLRAAVTSRLVADVDVAVLLSGGIDSSLVAAHAAAVHPGIHSFSVAIDDPRRDESRWSQLVADQLATVHHVIKVGDQDALGVVDDLSGIYDEPFADSSAIPTVLLSRFVSQHVKVALSGDGGDELFSGYGRHDGAGVRHRSVAAGVLDRVADRALHTWWVRPQDPWRTLHQRNGSPVELYLERMGIADAGWVRKLGMSDAPLAPIRSRVAAAVEQGSDRWPEEADRELYLPGDLLVKIDRASMASGLEVRAPYLDPALASWAASLSAADVGAPGGKAVPRALARRMFGAEMADRPKQGFSVPLPGWLRGSLRELVELACTGELVSSGRLDRRRVRALATALDRRFDKAAGPLWTIAMFELWHRRWG